MRAILDAATKHPFTTKKRHALYTSRSTSAAASTPQSSTATMRSARHTVVPPI